MLQCQIVREFRQSLPRQLVGAKQFALPLARARLGEPLLRCLRPRIGRRPFVGHRHSGVQIEAVTTRDPSGLNAALQTSPRCPLRAGERRADPVWSAEAVAIRIPSELNAAVLTGTPMIAPHGALLVR
jgi:hypothetical protein